MLAKCLGARPARQARCVKARNRIRVCLGIENVVVERGRNEVKFEFYLARARQGPKKRQIPEPTLKG